MRCLLLPFLVKEMKNKDRVRHLGPVDVEACKTYSLDSFDLLSQSPGNESFS